MEISFTPSPDVAVVLNTLLDIFERRTQPATHKNGHGTRSIKITLNELALPAYFSQTDPQPRLIAHSHLAPWRNRKLAPICYPKNRRRNISSRSEADTVPKHSGVEWKQHFSHITLRSF